MKVIEIGVLPKKEPDIWYGEVVRCSACGFRAVLDEDDTDKVDIVVQARSPDGPVQIKLCCPTCNARIDHVFRPILPEAEARK